MLSGLATVLIGERYEVKSITSIHLSKWNFHDTCVF